LEYVDSSLGDARQSNNVGNCTHGENKQLLVASQIFGELVDHGCNEALHGAELGVQPEEHQHEEEAGGPDRGERHLQHGTGVGEESKTGSGLGHICDIHSLLLSHEAKEGKDDETGEHGGARVDGADNQGVLVHVVVVLVVRAQGDDRAETEAVGEEDLGGGVNPDSRVAQLGEVGRQVEVDSVSGALEGNAAEEEDKEEEEARPQKRGNAYMDQKTPVIFSSRGVRLKLILGPMHM